MSDIEYDVFPAPKLPPIEAAEAPPVVEVDSSPSSTEPPPAESEPEKSAEPPVVEKPELRITAEGVVLSKVVVSAEGVILKVED